MLLQAPGGLGGQRPPAHRNIPSLPCPSGGRGEHRTHRQRGVSGRRSPRRAPPSHPRPSPPATTAELLASPTTLTNSRANALESASDRGDRWIVGAELLARRPRTTAAVKVPEPMNPTFPTDTSSGFACNDMGPIIPGESICS